MPGELVYVKDFGGVVSADHVFSDGTVYVAAWEDGDFGFAEEDIAKVIDLGVDQGTVFSASGDRDFVRRVKVKVTRRNMEPVQVARAAGFYFGFAPFSAYLVPGGGVDHLAVVTSVSAAVEDGTDRTAWVVTVTYSTQVGEVWPYAGAGWPDDPDSGVNHPEREPPGVEWDAEPEQFAMDFDLDGKPFTNSARTPFVPVPTFPFPFPAVTITRNTLGFDLNGATSYAYAVNSDDFLGWPPGTALMFPWRSRGAQRGALRYFKTGIRIKFNPYADEFGDPEGWQPHLLDAGFHELRPRNGGVVSYPVLPGDVDASWEPVPIVINGMTPSSPVLLNGTGQRALVESPGDPFEGKILPVRLPFRVYVDMPFNVLFADILDYLG